MSFRVGRTVVLNGSRGNDECSRTCLTITAIVILIAIPSLVYYMESTKYEMGRAFFEASEIIEELPNDEKVYQSMENKLIHYSSSNVETTEILHDPDFNIESAKASKLVRKTEFCQWQEHHSDKKQNGHTVRTYYYVKGWVPHTIISAFFDQPFKHNNPQRNPTPRYTITADTLKTGAFTVTKPLLEAFPVTNTLHFTDRELQKGFYDSAAFREHGFRYIGGGYFYSAYEASPGHTMFKLAGEYLEGSLFDIQVGDLFSGCTAGDIRIRFDVAVPDDVSIVGKQVGNKVVPYITSHEFKLGLMHHGIITAEQMFEAEMKAQQILIYITRVVLVIWSIGVAGAWLGLNDFAPVLLGALFLTGLVVGSVWIIVWGNLTSFVLTSISTVGIWFLHQTSSPKIGAGK